MTPKNIIIDSTPNSPRAEKAPEGHKYLKRRTSSNMSGRHSNQWLFGNISLTETAKNLLRRKDSSSS
jgi:hypothetical protein